MNACCLSVAAKQVLLRETIQTNSKIQTCGVSISAKYSYCIHVQCSKYGLPALQPDANEWWIRVFCSDQNSRSQNKSKERKIQDFHALNEGSVGIRDILVRIRIRTSD